MLTSLWTAVLYKPLYNALIAIIEFIPGHNVAVAVILLTIIVKLILFPLTRKSIISQAKLKELEPEIARLKEQFPDKQEQAKKTMELYKQYNVNPFSGCLLILIQIPIIFALYYVFYKGLNFNPDMLYSFVEFPKIMSMEFLGIMMQGKSIVLAVLAGVTQFVQAYLSTTMPTKNPNQTGFAASFAQSMNIQVRYVLPVIVAIIAYQISAAVALYWVTSNLFTIGQEFLIRRKLGSKKVSAVTLN